MNNLDNFSIVQLIPPSLRNDEFVITVAEAFQIQIRELYTEVESIMDFNTYDNMPEELLDFLAFLKHVDFYDSSLSIEIKREILKNNTKLHKKKGTKQAVEDAATTVFGSAKIEEWFEYDGDPFFFKVKVDNSIQGASQVEMEKLEKLVNEYKNTRSWIEKIDMNLLSKNNLYVGCSVQTGETIKVYPWTPSDISSTAKVHIGTGNKLSYEKIKVYQKEVN